MVKQKQMTAHPWRRTVLFALGLVLLLGLLSWLYRPRDNDSDAGMRYARAYGWLSEPVGSIDVFFVGSSEFYAGVSPLRIWDESGITSYDMATAWHRLYRTEQFIQEILAERTPKLIVIDGYVMMVDVDVNEALFNLAARRLPILETHENWKLFTPERLSSGVSYTTHNLTKGFRPRGISGSGKRGNYMSDTDSSYTISQLNFYYLRRIRRLCQDAGVELLIVAIPSTKNWSMERANALQDYSARVGVNVLDLNLEDVGIDPDSDYRDDGDHLNAYGAKKVSVWLAEYLRRHYDLPDHRDDPAYHQWQEDYKTYSGS